MVRRWWVVLPGSLALVVAAVLQLSVPDRRLFVSAAPALVVLVAGVLVSVALLVATGVRDNRSAAITSAREDERRQERLRNEDARRRFVRRLDHELKNPLTALAAALNAPGDDVPRLDVARAQTDRLRGLLNDLRRVADIETVELDLAPVGVGRVVVQAVESAVGDSGDEREVLVDVPSVPWPVPDVRGDADLLLIAFYNVVANALKYSGPQDAVEVRVREQPGGVVVQVADAGPGIPSDEQDLVWEELARGRSAFAQAGSGIGLALVRAVVVRHGGAVGLRSRDGAGTSVELFLPISGPSAPFRV